MEEGQRPIKRYDYWNLHGVLILVVMEEGQRQDDAAHVNMGGVLILVVMEEGQRPIKRYDYWNLHGVLILVVMEEGQRRQI